MDIMVNKLHRHLKKHSHNIQWGLFLALVLSGSLLAYIGYFDKVLFSKKPAEDGAQVALYYHKAALGAVVCDNLYPIYRNAPLEQKSIEQVVKKVITGPTSREKQNGYISIYSPETQSIVQSVQIKGKTAYISFYDIRKIFPSDAKCLQESIMAPVEKALEANFGINKVIFAINYKPEDFYQWIGISCSILNSNCYQQEFASIPAKTEPEAKTITSVSGKIKFDIPQEWYAQLDGYAHIEEKYSGIITATRVINWNEFETKAPSDNGVEMTIIEIFKSNKSITEILECSQVNTCTSETRNDVEITKNTLQKERGIFEIYSFTKDDIIYVIEIQFPYKNTVNQEYDVTQKIINDLIIHI
jgi:hypothetical protein